MQQGPIEEGARVAVSISESLRQQPLVLAVLVLNIIFIGFTAWILATVRADNRAEFAIMKATCDAVTARLQSR